MAIDFQNMTDEQLKRVAQSELSSHLYEENADRGYSHEQSQYHRKNYTAAVRELELRNFDVTQDPETLRLIMEKKDA